MRAFVAVELPEAVRTAVARLQDRLKTAGADVKWTERENVHVTLRFLGEIDEAQRAVVERAAEQTASRVAPIEAVLDAVGAFPSTTRPRVLWVGIGQGGDALGQLAAAFEQGVAAAGFAPEDRQFVAHATIGRVRSPRGLDQLATALEAAEWAPPGSFRIDHLTLFRSDLSSAGPKYTPLRRVPLAGR